MDDGAPVVLVSERLRALVALWQEDEELRAKVLERARARLARRGVGVRLPGAPKLHCIRSHAVVPRGRPLQAVARATTAVE